MKGALRRRSGHPAGEVSSNAEGVKFIQRACERAWVKFIQRACERAWVKFIQRACERAWVSAAETEVRWRGPP
jgi:hypothetical protein